MFAYSRACRLITTHDFQHVFAKSCKVTRKQFIALYRPNQLLHARLGLVISKHHIKRAVDRNYLRRLCREQFRHTQQALKGLDIIVLVRSKSPLPSTHWRSEIDKLWQLLINSSAQV